MAQAAVEFKRGRFLYRGHRRGRKGLSISDDSNAAKIGKVLTASATFNPASLIDAAGETTTVNCAGAALGDFALAAFSVALAGLIVTAWVSAAGVVSVRFQNETAGTVDLASGTLKVLVFQLEP